MNAKYPKINYIGNKEKISDWIIGNLPIKSGVVIDLFSGGCSMAYKLKQQGFQVLTNDVLYSSFIISKAIIENSNQFLTLRLNECELNNYYDDKIFNNIKWLSNKLFFEEEIIELSKLVNFALQLNQNQYHKYLFLSLLRRAMIRKLPYSRMNIKWEKIVQLRDEEYSYNKYGRKRSYHNKTFLSHILDNLDNYNHSIFDNCKQNYSFRMDAFKFLETFDKKVDLIYLDPPYPSTLNQYYEFYGAFDVMFNKKLNFVNFTERNNFLSNIEKIIMLSKNKSDFIAISLNNKTKPSVEEIFECLKKYTRNITIKAKQHSYRLSGKENKMSNYEILMIIEL